MLITEEIFQAFLYCETKSYLQFSGAIGAQHQLSGWHRNRIDDYKQKCSSHLRSNFPEDTVISGVSFQDWDNSNYCLVLDCMVRAQEMQSHIHALEQVTSSSKGRDNSYIPIRFVLAEKIKKYDKLLLAYDALVLLTKTGKMPLFGKIIHGRDRKIVKIQLTGLMKTTRSIVGRIAIQQENQNPPVLILNRHCPECEFQARCRQLAIEEDALSLLAGMTEKEQRHLHNKGIFLLPSFLTLFVLVKDQSTYHLVQGNIITH